MSSAAVMIGSLWVNYYLDEPKFVVYWEKKNARNVKRNLLMGKFRQILTELSGRDTPMFSFLDDNLIKHEWIFTKLGMCIDTMEI